MWIWKRKKSTRSGLPSLSHPTFLSLVAAELEAPSPSGTPMEIILPGGAKLVITSSRQIPIATALIRELANSQPCETSRAV